MKSCVNINGNDKVRTAVVIMGRESANKQCWECANCKEPTGGWDASKFRCAFLSKDFGTWHYDVPDECPCKGKGYEPIVKTTNHLEYDFATHDYRVRAHYVHAREKHPYFCDWVEPQDDTSEKAKAKIETTLAVIRGIIKEGAEKHTLGWDDLLNCEMWEVFEALANGDKAHAVEELYDMVAVLLRTIDVLEGRQKLGKLETNS